MENPDLTQNTRGQYTPILLISLVVYPILALKRIYTKKDLMTYYLPLMWNLLICVCPVVQHVIRLTTIYMILYNIHTMIFPLRNGSGGSYHS